MEKLSRYLKKTFYIFYLTTLISLGACNGQVPSNNPTSETLEPTPPPAPSLFVTVAEGDIIPPGKMPIPCGEVGVIDGSRKYIVSEVIPSPDNNNLKDQVALRPFLLQSINGKVVETKGLTITLAVNDVVPEVKCNGKRIPIIKFKGLDDLDSAQFEWLPEETNIAIKNK